MAEEAAVLEELVVVFLIWPEELITGIIHFQVICLDHGVEVLPGLHFN
jgi:hypothetical protein